MRRRFVLAFVALFALFAIGIGTSLVFIWRGTGELREVLGLHQIEDLRQTLSRSLQQSEKDLQVSGTVFANQLDDIIDNVEQLDQSVQSCFGCHHRPEVHRELERIARLTEIYKEQYSTYITAFLNTENRQRLQIETAATAEEIDDVVDAMLAAASPALQRRTEAATSQVERSWTSLLVTLVLTFLVAIAISSMLTRSVTEPLDRLVEAAGRIGDGDLGHRIEHHERHELGTLMDAFNSMSATLESKTERIEDYVTRLHRLNSGVVTLYASADEEALFARQVQAIDSLMAVELRGTIARTGLEDVFVVSLGARGDTKPDFQVPISAARLESVRRRAAGPIQVASEQELDGWPLGAWRPSRPLRNYMICWIDWRGRFCGGLLAVNRIGGEFVAEDGELLTALGQAVGPVLGGEPEPRTPEAEPELAKAPDGSDPWA